jgi:hypothetical protein
MIRLQDPGERGGTIAVTMTPFDLLSLQEACMRSQLHNEHRLQEYQEKLGPEPTMAEEDIIQFLRAKIKDDQANYAELQRVLDERNERLG